MDLRELVTVFGCSQLHDATQQLLRLYKSRFLQSLSEAERARADLSRPALLAAAFLLTAKKARARVDRPALLVKMGVTRAELATALEDFAARCEDQLAAGGGSRKGGKSQGQEDDADGADDGQSEPGSSTVGVGGSKTAARGGAKRRRGGGVQSREEAAEDSRGQACAAEAVAVDDFKLVLIGLGGPSGALRGAACSEGAAEEGEEGCGTAAVGADRPRRKACARAGKRTDDVCAGQEEGGEGYVAAAKAEGEGGDSDGGRGARRQRRKL